MPITHQKAADGSFSPEGKTAWEQAHTLPDSSEIDFLQSGSGASARTVQAKLRDYALSVKDFGALGDNSTDDTAAFQACIDACPVYGHIFIPKGDYVISDTLNFVLPVHLFGVGFGSQLIVDPAVSSSTDILKITPGSTYGSYWVFEDFAVTPRSSVGGRHNISIDATTKAVKDSIFRNLHLYKLNGNSFFASGTGGGEGSLVIVTMQDCTFTGGIKVTTCGDNVRVNKCHISGTDTNLNITFQAGASTFVFSENVCTADLGITVGDNATTLEIVSNEFETNSTFTGSNGALIDVAGSSGNACNDTIIAFNSFQIVNSITTNTIRCDYANRTLIVGNRMDHGITTSNDVAITANAADTMIGHNTWPDTTPVLSDSGTRTTFLSPVSGMWLAKQPVNISAQSGAAGGEYIRLGRSDDGNRYSSLNAQGAAGGTAFVSMLVHDGVGATSQQTAVQWRANSAGGWSQVPMGTSGSYGIVPAVANRNTTAVGNVGAGEDNLITYSLPLNSLSAATKGVRITAWGTTANNSNPKTVKAYFGSAILTTALTINQAGKWYIEALVFSTGTDTQDYVAKLNEYGTTAQTDMENGSLTEDDGAAISIKCTGTVTDGGGGINNNDIVQEGMMVEILN